MKYAAAGGVVALAVLFGAIMAIRSGGNNDPETASIDATADSDEVSTEPTNGSASDSGSDSDSDGAETDVTEVPNTNSEPDEGSTEGTESTTTTADPGPTEVVQIVAFNVGETSTALNGTVSPDERIVFTIGATAGQTLDLDLMFDSGSASYDLVAPDGTVLAADSVFSSTVLAADGVHRVIVTDTVDTTNFVLSISIPETQLRLADFNDPTGVDEIKFDPGAFSGTVSSAVVRAEAEIYTFDTNNDVTAYVSITSLEDNAVFQIYDPQGEQLVFESTNSSWDIVQAGLYTIIVTGTRGNASFDLTLELS